MYHLFKSTAAQQCGPKKNIRSNHQRLYTEKSTARPLIGRVTGCAPRVRFLSGEHKRGENITPVVVHHNLSVDSEPPHQKAILRMQRELLLVLLHERCYMGYFSLSLVAKRKTNTKFAVRPGRALQGRYESLSTFWVFFYAHSSILNHVL